MTTILLTLYVGTGWLIRAAMIPTVLRRQFTPGASIAWLGIVWLHPYVGLLLYFMVGESRLGSGRQKLHQQLLQRYRPHDQRPPKRETGDGSNPDDEWEAVATQALKVGRMAVVGGNSVDFISDSGELVEKLTGEIRGAKSTAHLLYYTLAADATGERVATALEEATGRGVSCRLLVDQFASRAFLKSPLAKRLKENGIKIAAALPSSILRRRDLRNHRKLAIIDCRVAYAGSQNMINPDYGGRRGAPWHDLTGRFTGPIVNQFEAVFDEDWAFETCEELDPPQTAHDDDKSTGVRMQLAPTGPVSQAESYRRVLLGVLQAARRKIVLTTPYFVPDDPVLITLMMAADRDVDVTMILPQVPDQFFSAAAGRAHYARLLEAGIKIFLYQPGLIHAKSATIDETLSLFGSANLDIRSFHLNFELSTLIYDKEVTDRLRGIQMDYVKQSKPLTLDQWRQRNVLKTYCDSAVSLLSPLL